MIPIHTFPSNIPKTDVYTSEKKFSDVITLIYMNWQNPENFYNSPESISLLHWQVLLQENEKTGRGFAPCGILQSCRESYNALHGTYSQADPDVQLCILMTKNTKNLNTFWKLVKVQFNHL
jgi:hypothetical protein